MFTEQQIETEQTVPRERGRNRPRRSAAAGGVLVAMLLRGFAGPVSAAAPAPRVVLNEIMYHPANDRDDLQYLELHNPGSEALDLSGWSLASAVRFRFPRGTQLPPDGYGVVCRSATAFKAAYGESVPIMGTFAGTLSHKGERLDLLDPRQQTVDTVDYNDRPPWPTAADGHGSSLERICPRAHGGDPDNWCASERKPGTSAGGSPGRPNGCFSATPLPRVAQLACGSAVPGQPITVTAALADGVGITAATLHWETWAADGAGHRDEVPMALVSGDARRGVYRGNIPPQPADRLIRFALHAATARGAERRFPASTDLRPMHSCATFLNTNDARIPFFKVLSLGRLQRGVGSQRARAAAGDWSDRSSSPRAEWNGAVLCLAPGGKEAELFDYVTVRPRKGGLKVHFQPDRPWGELSAINVIFEGSPRWALSEPLAYEMYRRAGVPTPASDHVRLWLDQRPLGYHLVVEQPNRAFLRRQGRDPDGNLYKLLWFGHGLTGQHEKKTNPHNGYGDLIHVVQALRQTSGAAQWDVIREEFNVDEMTDYFAVNMCIQNWDGFFNNYFAYHDLRPGGRWEFIPWDEDKTWGDHDGASPKCDWYEMPLTTGMDGDRSPRHSWFGAWPFGGAGWWRPPGHFSGPLLANPEFRRRFLVRLRELCETVFTPVAFGPAIDDLEQRLAPEILDSARRQRRDPEAALAQFRQHVQSFRNQLTHRREFLLRQLADQNSAAVPRE